LTRSATRAITAGVVLATGLGVLVLANRRHPSLNGDALPPRSVRPAAQLPEGEKRMPAAARIGLLLPGPKLGRGADEEAIRAAELAVELAQEGPVELVPASPEAPWGAGAREIVRLAFDEQVSVVVGAYDAATAHIALQILTKAQTPLITPWATSTALTDINLPWVFRMCPDDDTQAGAIARAFPSGARVALCRAGGRDADLASEAMGAQLAHAGHTIVSDSVAPDGEHERRALADALADSGVSHCILLGGSQALGALAAALADRTSIAVFGHSSTDTPAFRSAAGPQWESTRFVVTQRSPAAQAAAAEFEREYARRFGAGPTSLGAYTYEAVRAAVAVMGTTSHPDGDLAERLHVLRSGGPSSPLVFDGTGERILPGSGLGAPSKGDEKGSAASLGFGPAGKTDSGRTAAASR